MPGVDELIKTLPVHERLPDLLGASDDPHPRKTRRVEWVGETSPLDDPVVQWRLLNKLYTPTQEAAVRRAAAFARTRGDGVFRTRLLEHEHPQAQATVKGLHRSYIFSAKNGYVQDVDYHDYDVIFGSPVAHEFRDLDDPSTDQRPDVPRPEQVERMLTRNAVLTAEREPHLVIART